MNLDKKGRDLDLLKNKSDKEVAKIWNISRQAVRKIREKNKYPKFLFVNRKAQENIDVLKKNMTEYINTHLILDIAEYKSIYKCVYGYIPTKKDFRIIVTELNGSNFFFTDLPHSSTRYVKTKCRCDVCTLAVTIDAWLRFNNLKYKYLGVIRRSLFISYLANKYLSNYKEELNYPKIKFYTIIKSYLEKEENDLLEEIRSDIKNYLL